MDVIDGGSAFVTKSDSDAVRPGRPRVGDNRRGPSPVVRTRLSDADFGALARLQKATGRRQAELVREAVQQYLARQEQETPQAASEFTPGTRDSRSAPRRPVEPSC